MEFNALMEKLTVGSFGSFGLVDVVFSLVVPAVFTVFIVFTYKRVQMHNSFSPSFLLMLYMFASLSGGITLFIGENVARAFGLIGAMSIIRFRNALKEPIDAVFVLWALAVGMSCGAGYFLAGGVLTLVIGGVAFAARFAGLAQFSSPKSVVKVVLDETTSEDSERLIEQKLANYTKEYKKLHELSVSESGKRTYMYTLVPKKNVQFKKIETELSAVKGASVQGSIYRPSVNVIE